MKSKLKKYFILKNYHDLYKVCRNRLNIVKLLYIRYLPVPLQPLWHFKDCNDCYVYIDKDFYSLGYRYHLNNIQWDKDLGSNFIFPRSRLDNFRIKEYFNKGIDIKIPWEVSRFYFAPLLALNYKSTRDEVHYYNFKNTVLSFLESNPFLYGINWLSPMEVGIRAINLITAMNIFGDKAFQDSNFISDISISLIQHGEFINSFPEIYYKGHSTNHTVSNYVGLLFISLSLSSYHKSGEWIEKSMTMLEQCIDYQVYDDGVDFEGSIPYHRFVLEMFAYAAIIAQINLLSFSNNYYVKLFRMFEYTAAYIDQRGNAPQIGDDDSGRLLILESCGSNNHYKRSNDHSYLLSLGEHIFNYNFNSSFVNYNNFIQQYFPKLTNIDVRELNVTPRDTNKSISFVSGGAYLLKNKALFLFVSCFPQGQNGKGGHNHLDMGSFTLSINGYPVIVDPGTYTYTRSKRLRDVFRSYTYHNTIQISKDFELDLSNDSYWSSKQYYNYKLLNFTESNIAISIKSIFDTESRLREFSLYDNSLVITNSYNGYFAIRINLHPDIKILKQLSNNIELNHFNIMLSNHTSYDVIDYDYSPSYDSIISSRALLISGKNKIVVTISI